MQSLANFNHLIAQYEYKHIPKDRFVHDAALSVFCLISNRTIRLRQGAVAAKVTALFDDQIAPVVSFILDMEPIVNILEFV